MSEGRGSLAAGMPVTPNVHLVKPLGAGGMGAVWLADHTALKTRVVVKFMLGGLDANPNAVKRFRREAEAAAQVKSPHVVQMLDHGITDDGVPFIVMEHLEGHDLAAELGRAKDGRLAPRDVITIVYQVAKALTKVHAAGLLHRDIKPDNIFLVAGEDDVFVKLLDFGIAKSAEPRDKEENLTLDGETKTGQVVGTPYYMSPEQVTAQKTIDARSDLWALGVVTYEALTGQRPFDGPSFGALAVKIATGTPNKPSEVYPALPPAFDAWFEKACARAPEDRFSNAREMAEKLRQAFEGVVSLPPSRLSGDSSGERRVPTPEPSNRPPTPTELASTVKNDTPDPSGSDGQLIARAAPALARSEGGTAPVAVDEKPDDAADEKRSSRAIWFIAAVAVAAVGLLVFGMNGMMSRSPAHGASSAAASSAAGAKNATAPPPLHAPPSASSVAVAPSAAPSASVASSAPSAVPSASAAVHAHAAAVVPAVAVAKPAVTAKPSAAPSAKPEASTAPAGKPSATGGDILY